MDIPGYKMVRLIAEGGMATVYLAIQESLGRYVALKLLKKIDNPEHSNRFLNEGRIIASLTHPNIITIHDIGVIGDQHFISMEYPEGGDLKARIKGGMTPDAALDLLEGIGSCLDFVHRRGIVHRDIKPANILFRKDDTPILTDFGIAKQLEMDSNLTLDGTALGSPYYLSPEQAECKPLDGRTDIYGLGIVFYEMLMGRKPYQGESYIETVMSHKSEPIPALSPHLRPYQRLLDRMIAKDPNERFASAAEMVKFVRGLERVTPVATISQKMLEPMHELRAPETMERAVATTLQVTPGETKTAASRTAVPPGDRISAAPPARPAARSPAHRLRWPVLGLLVVLGTASLWFVAGAPDRGDTFSSAAQPGPTTPPAGIAGAAGEQAQGHRPADRASGPESLGKDVARKQNASPPARDATTIAKPKVARQSSTARRLQSYLSKAASALAANRLTTPARNNAYYFYQRAGKLAPRHAEVKRGFAAIANRYADLAAREIARHDNPRAELYVQRGLKVESDNPRLHALEETIEQRAKRKRIEQEIRGYLAQAKSALDADRLATPPQDNAYFYYRQVLKLSPHHAEATQGLVNIADRYAQLAEQELDRFEYSKARLYVDRGLDVQPGNPRLEALKKRTNAVEDVPRRIFGGIKSIFE